MQQGETNCHEYTGQHEGKCEGAWGCLDFDQGLASIHGNAAVVNSVQTAVPR